MVKRCKLVYLGAMTQTQRALDLFAGPGGWDVHDSELGIESDGVENDTAARATREAAGLLTVHDDVTTFKLRPGHGYTGLKGSPPCQTFSGAGNGSGRRQLEIVLRELHRLAAGHPLDYSHYDDARTGLVLEPMRVILDADALDEPFSWIVLEQVPQVLPVWEAYAEVLTELGYNVATGNLQAEQYGVPQTRKRAVLIAQLGLTPVHLPTPTHSKFYSRTPAKLDTGVLPWVSMAQALGWEGFVQEAQQGAGMMARKGQTEKPIRRDDQPSFTITANGKDRTGKQGGCARLRMRMGDVRTSHGTIRDTDQPAGTITSSLDNGNYQWHFAGAGATSEQTAGQVPREQGQPAHTVTGKGTAAWVQRRNSGPGAERTPRPVEGPSYTIRADDAAAKGQRVTVQEAAVLQTFPAGYPWQGSKTKQYQQVGNAIPPLLAKVILQQVI